MYYLRVSKVVPLLLIHDCFFYILLIRVNRVLFHIFDKNNIIYLFKLISLYPY